MLFDIQLMELEDTEFKEDEKDDDEIEDMLQYVGRCLRRGRYGRHRV